MGIDTRLDPFLKNHTADPDAVVRSAPAEAIEKEWSDAAREAAAESRRRNVSGKTPKAPSGDLGGHHQALSRHGWEYTGDYGDKSKLYSHGGAPGEEIEVHPGGNWRHTAPGPAVPKTDEQGRRTLYPEGRVNVTGVDAKSLQEHLRAGAKASPLPGGKITTGPGGKIQSFEPNRYAHERFAPRKSETYSPVGKQAPPGPRVVEVGGDLDEDDVVERSAGPFIATEKIGWTDEARAAAAEARQRGFRSNTGTGVPNLHPDAAVMTHPDHPGHIIQVAPNGQWQHQALDRAPTKGRGKDNFARYLYEHNYPSTHSPSPGQPKTYPSFDRTGKPIRVTVPDSEKSAGPRIV